MYLSPSLVPQPGDLKVLGRSRASVGQVFVAVGRVYRPFGRCHLWGDSVAWTWVLGRVFGRWLQWSACWSRGTHGCRCLTACLTFGCPGYNVTDIYVRGLR